MSPELHRALDLCRPDFERALDLVLGHFGADSGTIHLMGDDGALHLRVASPGIPPAVIDLVRLVPVGKGMAGLAAERRRAVTACNIQTDASGDVRTGARLTALEGAIALPMFAGDRVAGVLGVANRVERTFTTQEQDDLIEAGRLLARWAA